MFNADLRLDQAKWRQNLLCQSVGCPLVDKSSRTGQMQHMLTRFVGDDISRGSRWILVSLVESAVTQANS